MRELDTRQAVRDALHSLNRRIEQALRRELSTPLDLGHSGRLQFEIDDFDYRIHLVQTEEDVLAEDAVYQAIPKNVHDAAEEAGIELFVIITEEIVPWFAERWRSIDGPIQYSPACVFFHSGLDSPRYDMEHDRWCSVSEVWPNGEEDCVGHE